MVASTPTGQFSSTQKDQPPFLTVPQHLLPDLTKAQLAPGAGSGSTPFGPEEVLISLRNSEANLQRKVADEFVPKTEEVANRSSSSTATGQHIGQNINEDSKQDSNPDVKQEPKQETERDVKPEPDTIQDAQPNTVPAAQPKSQELQQSPQHSTQQSPQQSPQRSPQNIPSISLKETNSLTSSNNSESSGKDPASAGHEQLSPTKRPIGNKGMERGVPKEPPMDISSHNKPRITVPSMDVPPNMQFGPLGPGQHPILPPGINFPFSPMGFPLTATSNGGTSSPWTQAMIDGLPRNHVAMPPGFAFQGTLTPNTAGPSPHSIAVQHVDDLNQKSPYSAGNGAFTQWPPPPPPSTSTSSSSSSASGIGQQPGVEQPGQQQPGQGTANGMPNAAFLAAASAAGLHPGFMGIPWANSGSTAMAAANGGNNNPLSLLLANQNWLQMQAFIQSGLTGRSAMQNPAQGARPVAPATPITPTTPAPSGPPPISTAAGTPQSYLRTPGDQTDVVVPSPEARRTRSDSLAPPPSSSSNHASPAPASQAFNSVPGAPNGAPSGIPNGAPNGAPNGTPNGVPNNGAPMFAYNGPMPHGMMAIPTDPSAAGTNGAAVGFPPGFQPQYFPGYSPGIFGPFLAPHFGNMNAEALQAGGRPTGNTVSDSTGMQSAPGRPVGVPFNGYSYTLSAMTSVFPLHEQSASTVHATMREQQLNEITHQSIADDRILRAHSGGAVGMEDETIMLNDPPKIIPRRGAGGTASTEASSSNQGNGIGNGSGSGSGSDRPTAIGLENIIFEQPLPQERRGSRSGDDKPAANGAESMIIERPLQRKRRGRPPGPHPVKRKYHKKTPEEKELLAAKAAPKNHPPRKPRSERYWLAQQARLVDELDKIGFSAQPIDKGGNDLRYGCSLCQKDFETKLLCVRHAVEHLNYKPFRCASCDMEFTRCDTLQRHLKGRCLGPEGRGSSNERTPTRIDYTLLEPRPIQEYPRKKARKMNFVAGKGPSRESMENSLNDKGLKTKRNAYRRANKGARTNQANVGDGASDDDMDTTIDEPEHEEATHGTSKNPNKENLGEAEVDEPDGHAEDSSPGEEEEEGSSHEEEDAGASHEEDSEAESVARKRTYTDENEQDDMEPLPNTWSASKRLKESGDVAGSMKHENMGPEKSLEPSMASRELTLTNVEAKALEARNLPPVVQPYISD